MSRVIFFLVILIKGNEIHHRPRYDRPADRTRGNERVAHLISERKHGSENKQKKNTKRVKENGKCKETSYIWVVSAQHWLYGWLDLLPLSSARIVDCRKRRKQQHAVKHYQKYTHNVSLCINSKRAGPFVCEMLWADQLLSKGFLFVAEPLYNNNNKTHTHTKPLHIAFS